MVDRLRRRREVVEEGRRLPPLGTLADSVTMLEWLHRRGLIATAGLLPILIITAACGRADPSVANPITTAPLRTQAPPTTVAGEFPVAAWGMTLRASTGDTQSFLLEVGRFAPLDAVERVGQLDPSGACAPDPERDLIAPIRLTLTNENTGFDFAPEIGFAAYDESGTAPFDAVVFMSLANAFCENVGDGASGASRVKVTSPALAPGESRGDDGYLVLVGARSPAAPKGDLARIRATHMYLDIAFDGWEIVSQTGPWGRGPLGAAVIPFLSVSPRV